MLLIGVKSTKTLIGRQHTILTPGLNVLLPGIKTIKTGGVRLNPAPNQYIMNILETKLPGLSDVNRPTFPDQRGFFREVLHFDELEAFLGHPFRPLQMNHSRSIPKVIRALHAENWNKLVYPVTGEMIAVLVDIRPDSATFGQVVKFTFGEGNRHALFIPAGVANSICVTGDQPVEYVYLVDAKYTGNDTTAIAWNDPDLAIDWPIKDPIISERDKNNPTLRQLFPDKFVK
jgi:dTDP-4-dehydrorhamnose 3,5-epimerase